jgi:poly(3-hydroxybutyrate) depolymerase
MDMDAAFYLQTIEKVFVKHELPKGELMHRGQLVDPKAIRRCGLMTIEGEKDDIAGVGQSSAALDLCVNIPESKKLGYVQLDVGHYGVFNGSRFRNEILPRMRNFWAMIDGKATQMVPPTKVNYAKANGAKKPAPVHARAPALAHRELHLHA